MSDRTETPNSRHHTNWQALVFNLDRCEHGRHEGDLCSGCHGPSLGNPFMGAQDGRAAFEVVPRQIGFTIIANPIVIPEVLNDRFGNNPSPWVSASIPEDGEQP